MMAGNKAVGKNDIVRCITPDFQRCLCTHQLVSAVTLSVFAKGFGIKHKLQTAVRALNPVQLKGV
jgi:hypothetical protein